jgi:alanine transaminase
MRYTNGESGELKCVMCPIVSWLYSIRSDPITFVNCLLLLVQLSSLSLQPIPDACFTSSLILCRNVYAPDRQFISAKKIAMETPGCEHLELVSFHSTSKGLIGECGRRGGYFELHNIDPYVHYQLYKLASSSLCSGVDGQLMTSLMVQGPKEGEASYEQFKQEEQEVYDSLSRRANALVAGLNAIDGISCVPAQGAMYAFPAVTLPPGALQAAKEAGQTPDTLYALSLLDETGICVVPASGFGQKEGRVGFRTTFLPPEDDLMEAIVQLAQHHKRFCEKYGGVQNGTSS